MRRDRFISSESGAGVALAPSCLLTTMHHSSGVCIRGQTSCPSAA